MRTEKETHLGHGIARFQSSSSAAAATAASRQTSRGGAAVIRRDIRRFRMGSGAFGWIILYPFAEKNTKRVSLHQVSREKRQRNEIQISQPSEATLPVQGMLSWSNLAGPEKVRIPTTGSPPFLSTQPFTYPATLA